jgi:hypothetical protein
MLADSSVKQDLAAEGSASKWTRVGWNCWNRDQSQQHNTSRRLLSKKLGENYEVQELEPWAETLSQEIET